MKFNEAIEYFLKGVGRDYSDSNLFTNVGRIYNEELNETSLG